MNAYSENLRKKIIESLWRGMTKTEAARAFSVSRSSLDALVSKWAGKIAAPSKFAEFYLQICTFQSGAEGIRTPALRRAKAA
jgi:Helix-turn-helix domain